MEGGEALAALREALRTEEPVRRVRIDRMPEPP
jgi:hypothetical protein